MLTVGHEVVPIGDKKVLKISSILPTNVKEDLFKFLMINGDHFSWKPNDMSDINSDIIVYELKMDHIKKPVQ